MAFCLTGPSYYLNQCWLIIEGVLWHSPESNFTWRTWWTQSIMCSELTHEKSLPCPSGTNELNCQTVQLAYVMHYHLKYDKITGYFSGYSELYNINNKSLTKYIFLQRTCEEHVYLTLVVITVPFLGCWDICTQRILVNNFRLCGQTISILIH